jgi:FKBP-type peptidyl-prolyl cis-trans isomerase
MDINTTIKQSGLKTELLSKGSGKIPVVGDTVMMHYILSLGDGVSSSNYDYDKHCYVDELVESTYEGPLAGPVKITIGSETAKDGLYTEGDSVKGLDEALLEMKVGSKSRLLIPSELAYGIEGGSSFHTFHGYRTPPHRSLDMVVELLEIKKPEGESK